MARGESFVANLQHTGRAFPSDLRALFEKEGDEFFDVGNVGDISEGDCFVSQQRHAENRQDRVFIARGGNGAGEGFAAINDEVCHELEKRVRERRSEGNSSRCVHFRIAIRW